MMKSIWRSPLFVKSDV